MSGDPTRDTIVRLLENIASPKEIRLYLDRFAEGGGGRFAVIKVGGDVLEADMDGLCSSLAFLQRVGLSPIVLHGAGPQLGRALELAGVEAERIDGMRRTTPDVLRVARRVFHEVNLALVEGLRQHGVRASSIPGGVLVAERVERESLGLVGEVKGVELALLRATVRSGSLPVLCGLGETPGGQIVNVNSDWAAAALVRAIEPYKIIFLNRDGGIRDDEGRLVTSVNLTTDYEKLMAKPWLKGGMRRKLRLIDGLLADLPLSSSVSITRPSQLATELFSHRGSGTLLRRGERIEVHESWDGVDQERLRQTVESAFGRTLVPGYFESSKLYRLYVSESYRAAAILLRDDALPGVPQLDKFAVEDGARGEGLGRAVWTVMRAENPKLLWRARAANEVNPFYFTESDGCIKGEVWNVFWFGLDDDFPLITRAVEHVRRRPATVV